MKLLNVYVQLVFMEQIVYPAHVSMEFAMMETMGMESVFATMDGMEPIVMYVLLLFKETIVMNAKEAGIPIHVMFVIQVILVPIVIFVIPIGCQK